MSSLTSWFWMNGYGMYIWPAYGLVGVALVWNLLSVKWQKVRMRKQLQRWFDQQ